MFIAFYVLKGGSRHRETARRGAGSPKGRSAKLLLDARTSRRADEKLSTAVKTSNLPGMARIIKVTDHHTPGYLPRQADHVSLLAASPNESTVSWLLMKSEDGPDFRSRNNPRMRMAYSTVL
ncbi:hypothetical protein CIB48_g7100 [Xylaria polymorpha]|nr:hypothetical protein CIB48_g7100 [Xylaria polymorpha]